MKAIVDTNVLIRVAVNDEPEEAKLARLALKEADRIVLTLPVLCEFVWVLSRGYRYGADEIISAIRLLIASESVEVERPSVEAGLAMIAAGGDFADGVILFEGRGLGGAALLSFDRKAAALARAAGAEAKLLVKQTRRPHGRG